MLALKKPLKSFLCFLMITIIIFNFSFNPVHAEPFIMVSGTALAGFALCLAAMGVVIVNSEQLKTSFNSFYSSLTSSQQNLFINNSKSKLKEMFEVGKFVMDTNMSLARNWIKAKFLKGSTVAEIDIIVPPVLEGEPYSFQHNHSNLKASEFISYSEGVLFPEGNDVLAGWTNEGGGHYLFHRNEISIIVKAGHFVNIRITEVEVGGSKRLHWSTYGSNGISHEYTNSFSDGDSFSYSIGEVNSQGMFNVRLNGGAIVYQFPYHSTATSEINYSLDPMSTINTNELELPIALPYYPSIAGSNTFEGTLDELLEVIETDEQFIEGIIGLTLEHQGLQELTENPSLPLEIDEGGTIAIPSAPTAPPVDLTGITGLLGSILGAINGIWDFIESIFEFPNDVSLDFEVLKVSNIKNKFPFSIPFDFYNVIKTFSFEPIPPDFSININANYLKLNHSIDLSLINFVVGFFRYVACLFFIYILITKTRDFIKW